MSIKVIRDARRTDPETSYAAAAVTTEDIKGRARQMLWRLLDRMGDATDEEMYDEYVRLVVSHRAPMITDARLRHMRKDLVEMGLVLDTGVRRAQRSGSKARVWKVVR